LEDQNGLSLSNLILPQISFIDLLFQLKDIV
jgi:hypothetical protein